MSQDKIALVLDKAVGITKRTLAADEPVKLSGFDSFVMKDVPFRLFYYLCLSHLYFLDVDQFIGDGVNCQARGRVNL